jgi:hypothetical protein
MAQLDGYLKGNSWNKDSRTFEIKTLGTKEAGAILVGLNISGKDQEGNKVYGKPIDVKINIKSANEGSRVMGLISELVQFEGFFVPNNYHNQKEDKEVKGNQFLVFDSTTLVAKKAYVAPQAQKEEIPEESSW